MSGWPQIVIAMWIFGGLCMSFAAALCVQLGMMDYRNGKPGKWVWFAGRCIGAGTLAFILYAGGFWS